MLHASTRSGVVKLVFTYCRSRSLSVVEIGGIQIPLVSSNVELAEILTKTKQQLESDDNVNMGGVR
jgi:hypothetical protein